MFAPEDPLAAPRGHFDEPWQATSLAMATTMIREGHFTQTEWAEALGTALQAAEAQGLPDTNETYFLAVLSALEALSEKAGIAAEERDRRKTDWMDAYRRTPHGKPVLLG